MIDLIPSPTPDEPVLARLSSLKGLSYSDQEKKLPEVYLVAEQHLVEVRSAENFTKHQIRDIVRSQYQPLLDLPQFNLIFQPDHLQEMLLCKQLLTSILKRSISILGVVDKGLLISTSDWLSDVPDQATLPAPFDLVEELPRSYEEWIIALGNLSREIYSHLTGILGSKATVRLFENCYARLMDTYAKLETFPVVINLLPDKLLDNKKTRLLSRSQIERILLEKVINSERLKEMVKERTAELEAANEELESFAYSVSHDLRAPLRSIDGFSQLLMEDYGDQLDDQGKDSLRRMSSSVEKMAQLIDDLLELSRVTRSKITLERVDLTAIARKVAAQLQKTDPKRKVDFMNHEGLITKGDSSLLRLVLENLMGNAWKFTGTKSRPMIEFGVERVNDESAYFVRDNGVGFDMAYVDKLFTPFQRLHTETEFKGTGIGLASVKRIINRHGGRVWGESKEGSGSTFYFTLQHQKEE
ncbi:MAG: ATP-binding protein [Nitrososphaerales archaeon]